MARVFTSIVRNSIHLIQLLIGIPIYVDQTTARYFNCFLVSSHATEFRFNSIWSCYVLSAFFFVRLFAVYVGCLMMVTTTTTTAATDWAAIAALSRCRFADHVVHGYFVQNREIRLMRLWPRISVFNERGVYAIIAYGIMYCIIVIHKSGGDGIVVADFVCHVICLVSFLCTIERLYMTHGRRRRRRHGDPFALKKNEIETRENRNVREEIYWSKVFCASHRLCHRHCRHSHYYYVFGLVWDNADDLSTDWLSETQKPKNNNNKIWCNWRTWEVDMFRSRRRRRRWR